ncbi:hypothetical protein RUM43_009351 [Polyplax serrata]|uniref:Uncharacterized protein n=1 Tax=Polyplax serrata TaxID=468196 RepID=A0AAN8P837_POLSC
MDPFRRGRKDGKDHTNERKARGRHVEGVQKEAAGSGVVQPNSTGSIKAGPTSGGPEREREEQTYKETTNR